MRFGTWTEKKWIHPSAWPCPWENKAPRCEGGSREGGREGCVIMVKAHFSLIEALSPSCLTLRLCQPDEVDQPVSWDDTREISAPLAPVSQLHVPVCHKLSVVVLCKTILPLGRMDVPALSPCGKKKALSPNVTAHVHVQMCAWGEVDVCCQ